MNSLERSWYQPLGWSWLLLPFSLIFAGLSATRRWLFKAGFKASHRMPVPVIVVGNITVGGTGKTPITLWLCEYLQAQGLKPGIVSRGYGVKLTAPKLINLDTDTPATVGDEPFLLASRSGCPVVVCPDRVAAAKLLFASSGCNIIISDDGLQHYALVRDMEIILLDGSRGVGNGLLLPAGPLREDIWRLRQADLVLANSSANALAHWTFDLKAEPARSLRSETIELAAGSQVTLVSGIGNPRRFTRSAAQLGYHSSSAHFFADHYAFSTDDFADLPGPILMTEKDAVKCRAFAGPDWFYLPVTARLPQPAIDEIADKLQQIRSRYGV
ncbi:tetraacyldisaccharide 4'-kinase [Rheinheimera riviphila]|uniref:Tetraacyldisaccharide 4'-kinase n=1 Tax=Rheinheimera riviphila TaxID=1834037 RepID=A0A437R301_9GAMM|nr:tetraacyldisaccharide 4'-kinase [Rheinheimera riviphila]RVU41102.1 tetraacyldisaccharide 4'-kinase [Rheinheimera riviphila]